MYRIYAINLFMLLSAGAYFMLPVHLHDLGASEAQVGMVMASLGVTNVITMVWLMTVGANADPKRLIIGGALISSIGCAMIALSGNLWVITLGRLFQGVGYCLYFVAVNAWVALNSPLSERVKTLGYLGIVSIATQSIASSMAEAVAALSGYQAAFLSTVVAGLVSMVIAWGVPDGEPVAEPKAQEGQTPWWRGAGARIGLVALFAGGAFGATLSFSPLYLIEKSIFPRSLFFIVYACCVVAVRLLVRNMVDSMNKVVIARWCFAMLAAALLAMGFTESALTFGLSAALFGCGYGQLFPTLAAYSVEVVPGGHVRAMTLWSGGFIFGISVGSWFAGWLAELYAIGTALQVSSLMPVLALIILGTSRRVANFDGANPEPAG